MPVAVPPEKVAVAVMMNVEPTVAVLSTLTNPEVLTVAMEGALVLQVTYGVKSKLEFPLRIPAADNWNPAPMAGVDSPEGKPRVSEVGAVPV